MINRLVVQRFCTHLPKPPKLYARPWVYIFAGLGLFTYFSYEKYFKIPRVSVFTRDVAGELRNPVFAGLSRKYLVLEIFQITEKSIAIVFAPTCYGKTFLMQDLNQEKNTLLITAQESLQGTMNSVSPVTQFKPNELPQFLGFLEALIKTMQKPVILLDAIEKLPEKSQRKLLAIFSFWHYKGLIRLVVSTNNARSLKLIESYGNTSALEIPQLTREETHEVLKEKPGYIYEDVERIWTECEGGLDFALNMLEKNMSAGAYLEGKKKLIIGHLQELKKIPDMDLRIVYALMSVNSYSPLGNLYNIGTLSEELVIRGLMQDHIGSSVRFRNKFIIRAFTEGLIETS